MAIYVKRYNGSSWVDGVVKRYNGSSWVDAYTYRWDGSKWVQIYPETAITVTDKTLTGSGFNTWRMSYQSWNSADAKQGSGVDWDGSVANWGYCGIKATSWTGCGSITSVTKQQFSGTRGDAGYYNNDQTIKFYRSAVNSGASGGLTASDVTGLFTCKTGGPGKNAAISTKTLSDNTAGNFKNWLNNVSSKPNLYIYSNATGDYLDLTACKITASYVYTAATAAFEDLTSVASIITYSDNYNDIKNTSYHTMTIYNDEVGMTLEEIIQRREDGIAEDIDPTTVDRAYVSKPWSREYKIEQDRDGNEMALVEVFGLKKFSEVQMSLDKVTWTTMHQLSAKYNYMCATLPSDFNKMYDWVHIRCINTEIDEIDFELDIEPTIIIA